MKLSDPATWPKHPGLTYWRLSHAQPVAHSFHGSGWSSLCGRGVVLARDTCVIPTEGYTRLCSRCIDGLRRWGYLSRSEAVESS